MKCRVCGGALHSIATELPFNVSAQTIVRITNVPVLQCERCREHVVNAAAFAHIEQVLERADKAAELEIVPFGA